jgi:hypothetical protein
MKYINKNTGDSISESVYSQLSETARNNFIQVEDVVTKTHTVVETKSDSLSIGDAVAVVALSPIIIFKSIFG